MTLHRLMSLVLVHVSLLDPCFFSLLSTFLVLSRRLDVTCFSFSRCLSLPYTAALNEVSYNVGNLCSIHSRATRICLNVQRCIVMRLRVRHVSSNTR